MHHSHSFYVHAYFICFSAIPFPSTIIFTLSSTLFFNLTGAHESQRNGNGNDDNSPITKKPLDTDSKHDAITAAHDRQSITSLPATRSSGPAATMTTSSSIATVNNNKAQQKDPKTDSASESVTSFQTINTTNPPTALAQPPSRSTKPPQIQPISQPTGNNKLPASSAAIATKPNPNSFSSKLVLGEGTTKQLDRCTYGPSFGSIVLTTDSWKRANSVSENVTSFGDSADQSKGTLIGTQITIGSVVERSNRSPSDG